MVRTFICCAALLGAGIVSVAGGCSSAWPARPFGGYSGTSASPSAVAVAPPQTPSAMYPQATGQAQGGGVSFVLEPQPTGWAAVGASFQRATSGVTSVFTGGSTPAPTDDPTRLDSPTTPVKSATYVSWAKLHEQRGNIPEAEKFYRQALAADPRDLVAIVSFARMYQRQEKLDKAIELYRQAISTHPGDPVAYNDLALCLARQGNLTEATPILGRAVQMEPGNKLYRGNLAMVLVEANRPDDAFIQLSAAHTPDVAHYNLGYLLHKRGQLAAARHHFALAIQNNPNLVPARTMLARIDTEAPMLARGPAAHMASAAGPGTPPHATGPVAMQPEYPGGATNWGSHSQPAGGTNWGPYGNSAQPNGQPPLNAPVNVVPPTMPAHYDNGQPQSLPPVD